MALKLIQRIGLSFLQVRIASWRYSRGKRSLAENLASTDVSQVNPINTPEVTSGETEEYDIPEETEEIIEQLLVGLRDKDTIIRWSAAKGIGRVTSRLPKELADDVVTSVLELFSLRESDSAWHGGCLALAELGRRGLILPGHLPRVVQVVLQALVYDEQRGNFSVGAHIRDAACYVCWSFARAYDPLVLQPYVQSIAGALLVTTVFDREITCRRAASAAFQENVGRQGTFPHGIDILTETDYYAVGSRHNCFLNLSVYIAQFSEYTTTLIDHLINLKVDHWDPAVRELASKSMHNLTKQDPQYVSESVLPKLLDKAVGMDLNARHGAILSVAEIVHALSVFENKADLGADITDKIRSLVFVLDKRGLFKGLGGILMRNAACLLIEKASLAAMPFHSDQELQDKWFEMLDGCLHHAESSVRASSVSALPYFCTQYIPPGTARCDQLLQHCLSHLADNHMETRCGMALAIGSLPKFVLSGRVPLALRGLSKCAELREEDATWAEARRDAITALARLATTVGIGQDPDELGPVNLEVVFGCFLAGTDDYTLDSRGEIGAIVREAAMVAIQDTVQLVLATNPDLLQKDLVSKIFCVLLQQCTEKIDRTRAVAGSVFYSLLNSSLPHIPHRSELCAIFPSEASLDLNWGSPGETFHLFVRALALPAYRKHLLMGFVVSVGGLTESLVKYSSSALVSFLLSQGEFQQSISEELLSILKENCHNDRIVIPFFKMMNQLLLSDVLFKDPEGSVQTSFYLQLISLAWSCTCKSRDPQKIIASVDLFCNLLQLEDPACRRQCLHRLVITLCHRFPRIRKVTANQLYEAFVTYYDEELDERVNAILCDTDWNQSVEVLRPLRNGLCEILGLDTPTVVKK